MTKVHTLAALIGAGLLAACASTPAPVVQAAAPSPPVAAWTPQTPFPEPDGDLAYIRGYGAASGWTYTPQQEQLSLLQMFHWRAERAHFPGYVMVWGDNGRLHVNAKPPFDRAGLMALASPELRGNLVVDEVRHTKAEIDTLQKRLIAALEALGKAEFMLTHNYRNDRFDLTLVGADQAERLRKALDPELLAMTDITLGESPLVTF